MTRAVGGDDPFLLKAGTVEPCFAITKEPPGEDMLEP